MLRLMSFLFVFLFSFMALATDNEGKILQKNDELSALDILLEVRIPGENDNTQTAIKSIIPQITGYKIRSIVSRDTPVGFDPVADVGILPGTQLDKNITRQAVNNLWETGNYREIKVGIKVLGSNNVELVIIVKPMLRMQKVLLTGNKYLNDEEIKKAIDFVPGRTIIPEAPAMILIRNKLLIEYNRRGYEDSTASLKLETTKVPSEVNLVIDVKEGEARRYDKIVFEGLPSDIANSLAIRKLKLRKGIVRDNVKVQKVIEDLNDLLIKHDYLDAKVNTDYTEIKINKFSYQLIITIKTGIATTLKINGNKRINTRYLVNELKEKGNIRTTALALTAAATRVQKYCRKQGFFHSRVEAARLCYDKFNKITVNSVANKCSDKTVRQEILFTINEGPPVEVGHVILKGNTFIMDDELESEVFAFMFQKLASKKTFQQINSKTVDKISSYDDNSDGAKRSRGSLTPVDDKSRIYIPDLYFKVTEHLAELYMEHGFLNVKINDKCNIEDQEIKTFNKTKYYPFKINSFNKRYKEKENATLTPCVFIDRELDSLVAVFTIEEGPQTKLYQLTVEGNTPEIFTEKQLILETKKKIGQPYNEYYLRTAAKKIKQLYLKNGYMFVEVTWESTVSPDATAADVVFHVSEGPQVRVNKIVINSEVTKKWFIKDILKIQKGDLVTPFVLRKSEEELMNLGIFQEVTVQMQSPKKLHETKNIIVTVIESKPQYVELRLGIASEKGLRAGFEYGYKNIAGLALSSRLRLKGNYRFWYLNDALEDELIKRYGKNSTTKDLEMRVIGGLSTMKLPGTRGLLGMGMDLIGENINKMAFSSTKISSYFRVNSTYLKFLPIELKTGIEKSDITLSDSADELSIDPSDRQYLLMPAGEIWFWISGLSVSLDLRDNSINPTKGLFISLGGNIVRSFYKDDSQWVEDIHGEQYLEKHKSFYLRSMATISGYIPLGRSQNKTVLALSTSVGLINHFNENSITYADRYFYMGGVGTLRGFYQDSLVPQDAYNEWKETGKEELIETIGGEAMILFRTELRHPFTKSFQGTLFGEMGNLWRDGRSVLSHKFWTDRDNLKLRPVAGFGFHYITPVGPIAFDIGFNLNQRKNISLERKRTSWYFSIGSAF